MRDNKVNPGLKPGKNDKGHMMKGNPHGKSGASQKWQKDAGNWLGGTNQGVHGMKSPKCTPLATKGA